MAAGSPCGRGRIAVEVMRWRCGCRSQCPAACTYPGGSQRLRLHRGGDRSGHIPLRPRTLWWEAGVLRPSSDLHTSTSPLYRPDCPRVGQTQWARSGSKVGQSAIKTRLKPPFRRAPERPKSRLRTLPRQPDVVLRLDAPKSRILNMLLRRPPFAGGPLPCTQAGHHGVIFGRYCQILWIGDDQAASFLSPSTN